MKESILHYIWQQKLFNAHSLRSTDGEAIEVIDVGKANTDAGPDFFNAKIRIGATIWAGNIEIHVQSSDWNKHNHQSDKAYDSTILHVVKTVDTVIYRSNGEKIPQLELEYPQYIEENYEKLISAQKWIPCADRLEKVVHVFIQDWITTLLSERLEQKMNAIDAILKDNNNHWEEAFYIILARSFGFGINSQAFEMLARSLPLSVIAKHKSNQFQIEALLFGQAGFLENNKQDEYASALKKEYDFLSAKYNLKKISVEQWKLLRLRPDNFPHLRIAQLATLIHSSSKLLSRVIDAPEIDALTKLFQSEPSEYWKTHYLLGHESVKKSKKLGKTAINGLLINTVIPFLFCYATRKDNQELKEKSLHLYELLPAEKNTIITKWKLVGLQPETAFDTQALLQLKKHYCDDKKCLRCRFGHQILSKQQNPKYI